MPEDIVYLVDGTSICYRSFYAINLSTASGMHTGGVYGFYNTLKKLNSLYAPHYIGVCFDVSRKTFRQEKYKEYKIHRPPAPPDLIKQIPLVKQMLKCMNIAVLEQENYEADDLIASLTKNALKHGYKVVIVTSDKDMSQLLETGKVEIYNPAKDAVVTAESFEKEFGFKPKSIVDYLALVGDASDNIPGAKGIGKVGAGKLIGEYKTVENIFDNLDKLPPKAAKLVSESKEMIGLSKELIVLDYDGFAFDKDQLLVGQTDNEGLLQLFKELEFKSLAGEFMAKSAPAAVSASGTGQCTGEEGTVAFWRDADGVFAYDGKEVTQLLEEDCAQILQDKKIKHIAHDFKDQFLTAQAGVENIYFDTQVAAYLIDAAGGDYTLEVLAAQYLNYSLQDTNGAQKVKAVYELYLIFSPLLKEQGMANLFFDVEMPLVGVLADMQDCGVAIDLKGMDILLADADNTIKGLEGQIYILAGSEFNINSPKQLAKVLFEDMKIKPVKKTKTGYSTNEEVLQLLADDGHEIARHLLDYRQVTKLRGTYIVPLLESARLGGGKIHARFNQMVTTTGRLSSSNPNLQSIPAHGEWAKKLRKVFIPSDTGHLLVAADYSQIELRILAHFSQDEQLLSAFKRREDIHSATARLLFGEDCKEDKEKRTAAKRINFGILYGMGSYSLARELGVAPGDAQMFIDSYFARYPKVKEYIQAVHKELEETGYVRTVLGRRRRIADFNSPNFQMREFARRAAVNTPIQGSCADLIKVAMVNIHKELKQRGLKSRLIIQIHDELVLDVDKAELETVIKLVSKHMRESIKLQVPIEVKVKTGDDLSAMKEVAA